MKNYIEELYLKLFPVIQMLRKIYLMLLQVYSNQFNKFNRFNRFNRLS